MLQLDPCCGPIKLICKPERSFLPHPYSSIHFCSTNFVYWVSSYRIDLYYFDCSIIFSTSLLISFFVILFSTNLRNFLNTESNHHVCQHVILKILPLCNTSTYLTISILFFTAYFAYNILFVYPEVSKTFVISMYLFCQGHFHEVLLPSKDLLDYISCLC